jgi:LysM repeat protein
MVFVLVISAVFCAGAAFIAFWLLIGRIQDSATAQPSIPVTVVVDGEQITLRTDPAKMVSMSGEEVNPAAPEALAPEVTPAVDAQEADSVQTLPTFTPTATATPPPTSTPIPPAPVAEPVIFVPYTVVQSDSLYSIAQQQNSSIELMAKHEISAVNIHPGTVLRLPIANPAYCPGNRAYVVRDHDVLHGIAAAFNTTKEAIAALNGINVDDTIYTTQVICIPTS